MNDDSGCPIPGQEQTRCPFAPTLARIEEQLRYGQERMQEWKDEFNEIKEILQSLTEAKQQAVGVVHTARTILVAAGTMAGLILGWMQFWKNN